MDKLYFTANIFNDIAAIILFGSGIYFTFRLKFFQFRGLGKIFSSTIGGMFNKKQNNGSFKLFCASLAGAAGVGNITGVATAIAIGGPGAVFWMWVSAFLGMATKYAETELAIKNQTKNNRYNSSPMEYIKNASGGTFSAKLFAIFGILVSLMMGNVVQSRATSDAIYEVTTLSGEIIGPILCLIIAITVFGGFERIGKMAEKAVPIMTALYGIMCIVVIFFNRENIIQSFCDIFIYAFRPMSAAGGYIGTTVSDAVRCGVSKGIFSNEAGLGSAGLAYGGMKDVNPEEQAMWGAFDVFADTVIISTFTALTILTTGAWRNGKSIIDTFNSTMGSVGSGLGTICIALFAIASMTVWEYYGETCFAYLTKGKFIVFFRAIFCIFILFGATTEAEILWPLSEIANTMMMGVNMFGVLKEKKYSA